MKNLFAYGTLMCEEIMREVSGYTPPSLPGVVSGYSRRGVRGEHYPAILPEEGAVVEGLLYRALPEAAWERLDRFEGEMYARRSVEVALQDGTTLSAECYVVRPQYAGSLEETGWDYADFLRRRKAEFIRAYRGFSALR